MSETPENPQDNIPAKLPDNPSQADLDKKEFENLISQLEKGKTPSKDARARISVLARRLSGESSDFDWIGKARESGAYDGNDGKKRDTQKAEMAMRIDTVEQWLIWGWPSGKIVSKGAEMWRLSSTSVRNYIHRATIRIQQRLDRTREAQEGMIAARLADVYAIARDKGNIDGMIQALDRQAKLLGFHRPPSMRVEFTGKQGGTISVLNLPEKDDDGSGRAQGVIEVDATTTPPKQLRGTVEDDDEFSTG